MLFGTVLQQIAAPNDDFYRKSQHQIDQLQHKRKSHLTLTN
jgi:hypothetical protein